MPNGEELNEQLEFEERIKAMSSDDRTIFATKQIYGLANKVDAIGTKLDTFIENGSPPSKKAGAISGGISGGLIAVGIALIEYLRNR